MPAGMPVRGGVWGIGYGPGEDVFGADQSDSKGPWGNSSDPGRGDGLPYLFLQLLLVFQPKLQRFAVALCGIIVPEFPGPVDVI